MVNVLAKIAALGTEPDRQQFLENLFTFMESRGTAVTILPVICRQAVDLYKLYHLVKERGGMVEVMFERFILSDDEFTVCMLEILISELI